MTNYRKEIDGLRGISIILVVLFHAKIPFFSGGFFGVDIFFVISGYLITTIILDLYKKQNFSLIKFYEKRIRRIIPALYIVLITLVFYSFFFQAPYFAKDLSQSIFFTPIFFQNFLNIYEAANYFSLSYDLKSLGHTWSLSIEEQFYLFYPLAILIFLSKSRNFLNLFVIIFFLLSLSSYLYLGSDEKYTIWLFYLTPSRIWEILIGCLIALNIMYIQNKNLSRIGLFIILISILVQNFYNLQLYLRIFVVFGTSLILMSSFKNENNLIEKILKNKFIVFFGLISYSLYLWHVPIYSIFRDFISYELKFYENLMLILLAIFVSFISFKYIETPFRKNNNISSKFVFIFFFVGLILFPTYGFIGHFSDGFEKKKIESIKDDKKKYYVSFIKEKKRIDDFKFKELNSDNHILVIGDSIASDVVAALNTQNIESKRYNLNGPCFRKLVKKGYACNTSLKDIVSSSLKAKSVIIATDFGNENSEQGGIDLYNQLKNNNIKTKVLGGLNFNYISSSSFRFAKFNFYSNHKKFYFNNIQPNVMKGNKFLEENLKNDYIDKVKFICDTSQKICSLYDDNFNPIYYDTKHLTVDGYYKFGTYLKDKI